MSPSLRILCGGDRGGRRQECEKGDLGVVLECLGELLRMNLCLFVHLYGPPA